MSIAVVGTMAFDAIETPFGEVDKILGGAATYISLAASFYVRPVNAISIVGYDFESSTMDQMRARGINLEGVQVKKNEKSFFWAGRYHNDMNTRDTLVTELNVLAEFDPIIPGSYQGCEYLMLGNLAPQTQKQVIERLVDRPKLIVMDTMNFWMDSAMEALLETISMVDVLVINDEETRQLTGEYSLRKGASRILEMGPKYLVIKKGEHGALLFHQDEVFSAPGLPLEEVFDPTGAGDTFAGGFLGYLAHTQDTSFENMKRAVIHGCAMASFCVEKFGPQRLFEVEPQDLHQRIDEFIQLASFQFNGNKIQL